MSQEPTPSQERELVEFIPFGADASQKIKLTVAVVQNLIAVPTRSGVKPSREDAIRFMMLCRARQLNPFEGDAYLLGYDGRDGAQFSLITAQQVFLKRAEANLQFDGMESGVIVERDGEVSEREGDFVFKGETLLGGWAKVHRKDRKLPIYRRLNLSVFTTGRSRWEKDPAGMIVKCAEADALRSAFPTHLGGLYTHDERPPESESERFAKAKPVIPPTPFDSVRSEAPALSAQQEAPAPSARRRAAKPVVEPPPESPDEGKPEREETPHEKLAGLMEKHGFTTKEVIRLAVSTLQIEPIALDTPLETALPVGVVENILAAWKDVVEQIGEFRTMKGK